MSVRMSYDPRVPTSPDFHSLRVACGRGSVFSGGVAIRYVLVILWNTSCFPIMGPMAA